MSINAIRAARPRHAAARRTTVLRSVLVSLGTFAVAIALALLATGTSYALWNQASVVNASTVTSAGTGLTVNGLASYTLTGLDVTKLAPGRSVVAPLTLSNTGTVPLSVAVSGTAIVSQTNALAGDLTLRLTASASCTVGLAGGVTNRMALFTTTASPYSVAAGANTVVCLEVMMDADAPTSVRNGTTTFTMTFVGTQVRP